MMKCGGGGEGGGHFDWTDHVTFMYARICDVMPLCVSV